MGNHQNTVTLKIFPPKIFFILLAIVLILVLVNVTTQIIRFTVLDPEMFSFKRFNLDEEANIPTYFSTMILLFSATLLGLIALLKKQEHDSYTTYWFALSLIFFIMSLDEAACIHEMSIRPLRSILDAGGIFYYSWIIPGALVFVIVTIMFFRFWLHLPLRTRILFFISAACYVLGAIGFEGVSGYYASLFKEDNLTYMMITMIEETFELVAIVVFIYALLGYLTSFYPQAQIYFNFLERDKTAMKKNPQ